MSSRILRVSGPVQPSNARVHNRSAVLQHLFHHGPCSRAQLARRTGLTRVTISALVEDLLAEGIVEERGPEERAVNAVGRRGTIVALSTRSLQIAAIGITLKINYVEFSTWLQDVHANGDYELSLVDHAESHDFYKWTTPEYYYHYDNRNVQALYAKALAATDEKESDEYLKQAAKTVSEDAPADWLFGYRVTVAYNKGIKGFPDKLSQTVLPLWQISKAE